MFDWTGSILWIALVVAIALMIAIGEERSSARRRRFATGDILRKNRERVSQQEDEVSPLGESEALDAEQSRRAS